GANTLKTVHSSNVWASIAVRLELNRRETGSVHTELCSGLSRMRGNHHVRFLGEGAAAMPLPYPTKIQGFHVSESRQKSRSIDRIKLDDDGRTERPFLKSERTERLWSRGILEMGVECAAV